MEAFFLGKAKELQHILHFTALTLDRENKS